MPHHLAATISDLAAAKLNSLRMALGQAREADAVEFALRTADPQACRAAFVASLLGCRSPDPTPSASAVEPSSGPLAGVAGRRGPAHGWPAEELVARLAEALAARAGEEPSAALVPVVLALADRLATHGGRRERLASVVIHTLTGALLELYRCGSGAATGG